jgi:hypothetical protein
VRVTHGNTGRDGDESFPPGRREHSRDRCAAAVADLGEQFGNRVQVARRVGSPRSRANRWLVAKSEPTNSALRIAAVGAVGGARRRRTFHPVEEAPLGVGAGDVVEAEC